MNNISVEPVDENIVVSVSAPKDSVSVSFYPTENPQIYSELAKKYCDDALYFSNNAVSIIKNTVDNIENGFVNSVNAVAANLTNIDAVNSNKTNINAVVTSLSEINSTSANLSNINAVNLNKTNIDTVADNMTKVNTVLNNITSICTVAENISVIDDLALEIDRIDQSKGKESGSVSTNADILSDVKKYVHSTFDISKFTVVGSPIITDDGVASGFSSSNRLSLTFDATNADKHTIEGCFTYKNTGVQQDILQFGFYTWLINTDGNIQWWCPNNQNNYYFVAGTVNASTVGLSDGDKVWLRTEYIGSTTRTMSYSLDGINYVTLPSTTTNNRNTFGLNTVYLGSAGSGNSPYGGTIDLKQFSITVDGVEVFSGNKTGIDTIKPDNYTVVGTPTISADGIASGFSSSNYLITPSITFPNTTWKFEAKFNTTDITTRIQPLFHYDNFNRIFITMDGTIMLFASGNSVTFFDNGDIAINTNYLLSISYLGSGNYTAILTNLDTNTSKISTKTLNYTFSGAKQYYICSDTDRYLSGTIDLNYYKLYIDNYLVYSAVLAIPYTMSKTGSKIVDSIYRPLVSKMYEQFGYAPYYTLSDTDFTLPMGEVYGMIGSKTLRTSYRNGADYWEIYSDNTIEQGGICTSGTEVVLLKSYKDTNYILTIPYTAKTATTFTPSQSGNWIAKGAY